MRYRAGYCLVGLFFIERALSHIGVDVSWANAVCADVEARPLKRHTAGHLNNRGFCCRISFIRLIYIKIKTCLQNLHRIVIQIQSPVIMHHVITPAVCHSPFNNRIQFLQNFLCHQQIIFDLRTKSSIIIIGRQFFNRHLLCIR